MGHTWEIGLRYACLIPLLLALAAACITVTAYACASSHFYASVSKTNRHARQSWQQVVSINPFSASW